MVPLADAVAEVRHVPVEEYEHFDVLVRLRAADRTGSHRFLCLDARSGYAAPA